MLSYISPTSLKLFWSDPDEFYMKYMCPTKTPPFPQTRAMSVGSAFDCYVKAYIAKQFGMDSHNLNYLITKAVEPHNLEYARVAGMAVFQFYEEVGALADLMILMKDLRANPRMEFKVKGEILGVPISGKPDLYFTRKDGLVLGHDWKVNGYVAKRPPSPQKGYLKVYGNALGGRVQHKDCMAKSSDYGVQYNATGDFQPDWRDQLTIYMWALGIPVGEEFMIQVDQVLGLERVARHRIMVGAEYQKELADKMASMWEIINSGHLFRSMSKRESLLHQAHLDKTAAARNDSDFQALK